MDSAKKNKNETLHKRIYINIGKNKIKNKKTKIRDKMCNEIKCAIQYTVDLINNNINRGCAEECANSKKNVQTWLYWVCTHYIESCKCYETEFKFRSLMA